MITTAALGTKWKGKDRFLSDGGTRGAGRLVAKLRGGERARWTFFFQHHTERGHKRFLPIGPYDAAGRRGVSLAAARDRAAELSRLLRSGTDDLVEHFRREREAEERARREDEEARRRAEQEAQAHTLRNLLDAYVGHLERQKKESAAQVRAMFAKHVYGAAPDITDRRAANIIADRFVEVVGKLVEDGKGRQAAKLRSYLRAAYALAIRSKTDPAAPMKLRAFGIAINPVAAVAAMPQFNKTRDRALKGDELGALLRRLSAMEGATRDFVLLSAYTGGQRTAQLLRAAPRDVDLDAGTVTLLDAKGRRLQPRRHVVPLGKTASEILRRWLDKHPGDGSPIFGALRPDMAARFVSDLSEQMVKAKEAREPFELRDVRRSCETMLAALGVTSDVRAQLQSHGLGGIQIRHYDKHSYALEKAAAIKKLETHLDGLAAGRAADVVKMQRRKARR